MVQRFWFVCNRTKTSENEWFIPKVAYKSLKPVKKIS